MKKTRMFKKVERYRWVVWSVLAALYVFVTFHRMATGVVKTNLQDAFKIGAAQFPPSIGSMYLYAYFIMQIPSEILADKLGPRKTATSFSILAAIGSSNIWAGSKHNDCLSWKIYSWYRSICCICLPY